MVHYEVTVEVTPALVDTFAAHMRKEHIPQILATGCFTRILFQQSSPTTFRTSYQATSQAGVDRYLQQHAAHFRKDFSDHFPTGATPSRTVWTDVESYGAP